MEPGFIFLMLCTVGFALLARWRAYEQGKRELEGAQSLRKADAV